MKHKSVVIGLAGLLAAGAIGAAPPAQSWQLVASHGGERLEVDKSRISRLKNGQTAAWSRLTLGFDLPDVTNGASYSAIEALNTYNCEKGEYTTVKRVYLSGTKAVRDEKVKTPQTISVNRGSFEDKLLAEVCKPRSVNEMKQVAELAALLMNPVEPPPPAHAAKTLPADIRGEESKPAGVINTAESTPPPAAAPASTPAPAPAPAPDTGKPRLIDLPKIDKSQVEDPYKTAPAEPQKTAEPEKKPATKKITPAPVEEKSTGPALSAYERGLIERQLATSGRPKAVAKPRPQSQPQPSESHAKDIHWSYEGEGGPPNWGKLKPDFSACSTGRRQSPIDIRDGIGVDLEPIVFNYKLSNFSVIDNGHTVQVNVPQGASSIRIMERNFSLLQFHFHRPAEERVNGRSYEMVAHFVHKSDTGQIAVVAVLVDFGNEHPVIQTIWNNMPLEQNMPVSPSAFIDLARLLPEKREYWTYMGSLTTPPCTEGVLWMVLKQPIMLSPEQIGIFSRFYRHNARPLQAANGRVIKENR